MKKIEKEFNAKNLNKKSFTIKTKNKSAGGNIYVF